MTLRGVVLAVLGAWLFVFGVLPIALVVTIGAGSPADAAPPYVASFEFPAWALLASDDLYAVSFGNALRLAAVATMGCLAIGYPMALAITRAQPGPRNLLLLLVLLPFWTSFLVRVYAWSTMLRPSGLINTALIGLGVVREPLPLSANEFAVLVGIVYSYLPFMVLPLVLAIERIDARVVEAAADLGARPAGVLWRVVMPLSLPGIVGGCALVFIPAVGEFIIPDLLGGPDTPMIGRVLWTEFSSNRDWPAAAAIACALLVLLILPVVALQRGLARR